MGFRKKFIGFYNRGGYDQWAILINPFAVLIIAGNRISIL